MTPIELKAWRKSRRLSRAKLGKLLGRDPDTIRRYERDFVPLLVTLAITGLECKNPTLQAPKRLLPQHQTSEG